MASFDVNDHDDDPSPRYDATDSNRLVDAILPFSKIKTLLIFLVGTVLGVLVRSLHRATIRSVLLELHLMPTLAVYSLTAHPIYWIIHFLFFRYKNVGW